MGSTLVRLLFDSFSMSSSISSDNVRAGAGLFLDFL